MSIPEPTKVRRDHLDRPYIYDPEAGKEVTYTRISTFAKALSDGDALSWWKQQKLVDGLVKQPWLLNLVSDDLEPEARKARVGEVITRGAQAGGANDAADWGNTVHALTDLIDFSDSMLNRDMWQLDQSIWDTIDAYVELTKDMTPLSGEQFVVNDEFRTAGSYDRTLHWTKSPRGACTMVGDLKTGAVRLPDHGVQMSLYATSKHYDVARQMRVPGPLDEVDKTIGVIVHLPRPGVVNSRGKQVQPSLVPLDLIEGIRLAHLAREVRVSRRAKLALPLEGKS